MSAESSKTPTKENVKTQAAQDATRRAEAVYAIQTILDSRTVDKDEEEVKGGATKEQLEKMREEESRKIGVVARRAVMMGILTNSLEKPVKMPNFYEDEMAHPGQRPAQEWLEANVPDGVELDYQLVCLMAMGEQKKPLSKKGALKPIK